MTQVAARHEPVRDAPDARTRTRQRWTLVLTCAATFMLILDITVVNVALPDMERTLHAQLTDLEWVVDAYALALGSLLLVSGSVGDRIGRRRVFLVGMALFTAGSLWSSLASSSLVLITGRGVQGIGAACLFAAALAVIGHEFRGRERGRALGIWGAAIGAGLAIGPLVGGVLTDAFGWPSIFLVNVPLGIVMFVAALRRMPESSSARAGPVDWPGALAIVLCLFLLVFGLVEGNRMGWSNGLIVGCLGGAVLVSGLFFHVERTRRDPLFDVRLLCQRDFLAATLAVIGQGIVIAAITLYLLRDLQEVGGASPLVAGLEILPMTVVAFAAAMAAGRLASRRAPAPLLAAALLLLAGGAGIMVVFDPASSPWLVLVPGLLLTGAGWGATNPVAAHAALEGADEQATGMASGFNNTARQIGIAAGIGGLGAAFQARVASSTAAALHGVAPAVASRVGRAVAQAGIRGAAGAPPALRPAAVHAAQHGMTAGLHTVEVLGAAGALLVGVAVAAVGRRAPSP